MVYCGHEIIRLDEDGYYYCDVCGDAFSIQSVPSAEENDDNEKGE